MATKKAADHTLYHLSPKGFWKKFRDATVVSPYISSGLPLQDRNRYPQPGSRPEKYATPATKASDVAENPYWKRDVRRAYPQMSVVTQDELSTFLLQKPEQPAIADGSDSKPATTSASSVPTEAPSSTPAKALAVDLTAAIATLTSAKKVYSESNLPPVPPISYKRWRPEFAPDAPHDPASYFPMSLVK